MKRQCINGRSHFTIGAGISGMFGAGFTEGVKAGFTPVGEFGKIGDTMKVL